MGIGFDAVVFVAVLALRKGTSRVMGRGKGNAMAIGYVVDIPHGIFLESRFRHVVLACWWYSHVP